MPACVPKVGVEPTLPEENCALNAARLPIPPLRPVSKHQYSSFIKTVNMKIALFDDFLSVLCGKALACRFSRFVMRYVLDFCYNPSR